MDIRTAVRFAVAALLAVWVGAAAQAQSIKGFGFTVIGVDGKPMVGAAATLQPMTSENLYHGTTDKNGDVFLTNVPFSDKGFKFTLEAYGGKISRMIRHGDSDLKSDDTGEKKILLTSMNYLKMDLRKCTGIHGVAKDQDGTLLIGTPVTATNLDDESKVTEVKTDKKGEYTFENLPYSGKGYKLTLLRPGKDPFAQILQIAYVGVLPVDLDLSRAEVQQVQAAVAASPAIEARELYGAGDYQGAIAKAEEALAAEDAESRKAGLLIKGKSLEAMGRSADALAAYEAYAALDAQNKDVYGVMMRLAEEAGDKAKAAKYEQQYTALGGKVEGKNFNKGVDAFNAGNFTEAIRFFDLALKDDPNDLEAMKQLGICYGATQQFKKAIPLLETYLKTKQDATAESVLTYCKSQVK